MDRRNNSVIAILLMIASLVFAIGVVSASEPGGATVSDEEIRAGVIIPTAGDLDVSAGNVTVANLDTEMSTLRWAGVFGNATGSIVLGDSADFRLYEWTAQGNLVYFADGAVEWSSLQNANQAEVEGQFSWITAGSDNYIETFTEAGVDIGSEIFSITSDFAETLSSGGNAWRTYSLRDDQGTPTFVFAGRVETGNNAYDGSAADFQVILPEDGTGLASGSGSTTSWDVYVELI